MVMRYLGGGVGHRSTRQSKAATAENHAEINEDDDTAGNADQSNNLGTVQDLLDSIENEADDEVEVLSDHDSGEEQDYGYGEEPAENDDDENENEEDEVDDEDLGPEDGEDDLEEIDEWEADGYAPF
jgi:hypothetical protein